MFTKKGREKLVFPYDFADLRYFPIWMCGCQRMPADHPPKSTQVSLSVQSAYTVAF